MFHIDESGKSEILGLIDLHDFGTWQEHRLQPGDQIIGVYGIQNKLIRGIGFILVNMLPPEGYYDSPKRTSVLNCLSEDASVIEPRLVQDSEQSPQKYLKDEHVTIEPK